MTELEVFEVTIRNNTNDERNVYEVETDSFENLFGQVRDIFADYKRVNKKETNANIRIDGFDLMWFMKKSHLKNMKTIAQMKNEEEKYKKYERMIKNWTN